MPPTGYTPYELDVSRLLVLLYICAKAAALPPPNLTCAGAICIDAEDGRVLVEEGADKLGYPASVTKLMTVLLVLEDVSAGKTRLSDFIATNPAATRFGGSTVALASGERQRVDDLLAATLLRSANDAAAALACDRGGNLPAFITRMNTRAAALGMTRTRFVTPNGLTYGSGPHDTSCARDLALLCRELLRHPEILSLTSCKTRTFRPISAKDRIEMTNHNRLLTSYPGCDGLKTGWTVAAGASIATTAQRNGRRVIAIVLSAQSPLGAKPEQRLRDTYVAQLMDAGFKALAILKPTASSTPATATKQAPQKPVPYPSSTPSPTPASKPPATPLFNPKPSR